ncbi:SAP domain protein, partial [Cooperia oncophora]
MSSRPRRSCAKGDTSVLSPSTIFLWSDARLRQELTRRGLSRVGIRQDLIDRLLDDINGIVKKEEPRSCFDPIEVTKEKTIESQDVKTEPPFECDAESAENRT